MTDEHDRTGQAPQEFGEVGRVASEIAKRVGEPDGGKPAVAQGANLGVEAGRVGPGTVDQDNRRVSPAIVITGSSWDGSTDSATVRACWRAQATPGWQEPEPPSLLAR
jgi:hypothetical protein